MATGSRPVRSTLQALRQSCDPRVLQRTRQRVDDRRDATREMRRPLDLVEIRTEPLMRLPDVLDAAAVTAHVVAGD